MTFVMGGWFNKMGLVVLPDLVLVTFEAGIYYFHILVLLPKR